MVGVLGEATGRVALEKIRSDLKKTREGRLILSERPLVDSTTINGDQLRQLSENTFGHAYGRFLERYGFDPDDRTPVALVDDEELASMEDDEPLEGRGHDHFAFNNWQSDLWFDNLEITPL